MAIDPAASEMTADGDVHAAALQRGQGHVAPRPRLSRAHAEGMKVKR